VDIAARTFDLLVDDAELEARKEGWTPLPAKFTKGVLAKYAKLVHSASTGAYCGTLGATLIKPCRLEWAWRQSVRP
jgi:dihydroxy-acid dehydratase